MPQFGVPRKDGVVAVAGLTQRGRKLLRGQLKEMGEYTQIMGQASQGVDEVFMLPRCHVGK